MSSRDRWWRSRFFAGDCWIFRAIHSEQIREHGGLLGLRDETALESALARPQQKWHDVPEANVASLAAAYGFGLVRNHPYRDGNKRIGFLSIVTFLGINGYVPRVRSPSGTLQET